MKEAVKKPKSKTKCVVEGEMGEEKKGDELRNPLRDDK